MPEKPNLPEKVIVLIPAFNEAETIGALLESLREIRKQRIIDGILVVDDGSTDSTGRIAAEKGANVLELKKNSGKTFAFYAGAREAALKGATVIMTLDADLKPVTAPQVKKLLEPVIKRECEMSVGSVVGDMLNVSGQRAIRASALQKLFRGGKQWEHYFGVRKGALRKKRRFSLERILNNLITKRKMVYETNFETQRTFVFPRWTKRDIRSLSGANTMQIARRRMVEKIKLRREKARRVQKI